MFKKIISEQSVKVGAPVNGQLISIENVSDDIFSQKMLGDGFAIKPNDDDLFSPLTGTIKSIFPTKHAITIQTPEGLECLLHLGIDTVELQGKPFFISVTENQQVKLGDHLGRVNRQKILDAGKKDEIILVVTNMNKVNSFPNVKSRDVIHGDLIGEITLE